jgi:hypothetical protein
VLMLYGFFSEDGNDSKKKKQPVELTIFGNQGANKMKQNKTGQMIKSSGYVGALTPKEGTPRGAREVLLYLTLWTWSWSPYHFDSLIYVGITKF